ncbi:hypothetical protein AVEN_15695-1 [Araneus ventricosus]|uniref:Uncharacterized protein n=1 Tax=Araneus ventricosus TaxID=182803 RepID=A0A4Y2JRN7_ARAVE|nr:hypothetical protein AVEN_15695-1 [Araneus ventricosus]
MLEPKTPGLGDLPCTGLGDLPRLGDLRRTGLGDLPRLGDLPCIRLRDLVILTDLVTLVFGDIGRKELVELGLVDREPAELEESSEPNRSNLAYFLNKLAAFLCVL